MSAPPEHVYQYRDGKLVKAEASNAEFPNFWQPLSRAIDPIGSAASQTRTANDEGFGGRATPYIQPPILFPSGSGSSALVQGVVGETSQVPKADDHRQPASENDTVGSDDLRSPERVQFSQQELLNRDREAVQYTKSLLAEGDTLVYIKYPGRCYDSTGFAISDEPHRVHSSLLLATGSKVFAELLGPTNQYRILRRKKLVNHLPSGVRFVIDLTPPEEGEVAVDLTTELSCSLGIRSWYTAEKRCLISHDLVGGRDAVTEPPVGSGVSLGNAVVEQFQQLAFNAEIKSPRKNSRNNADDEFNEAIELSKQESLMPQITNYDARDVPEYCPIRHRLGIANLLQIIERKDLRLDSAPKMWTLFVLARYFDCPKVVVDYIVTWMIASQNSQFIEILPEMSCNIGFGLQIPIITRAAFCILVGEEALSLASRRLGSTQADSYRTNQFGRPREDINEDLQTSIEYASKEFHDRVLQTWDRLTDRMFVWFLDLPEYRKLCAFEDALSKRDDTLNEIDQNWRGATTDLAEALRRFVRGLLTSTLCAELSNMEVITANKHRVAESYKTNAALNSFAYVYRKLTEEERLLTRFPWKKIRDIDFGMLFVRREDGTQQRYAYQPRRDLVDFQNDVNDSIMAAILSNCYCSGLMPLEAYSVRLTQAPAESEATDTDQWTVSSRSTDDPPEYWPSSSGYQMRTDVQLPIRRRNDSPTVSETINPTKLGFSPSIHKPLGTAQHAKETHFKPALVEPKVPADWDMPYNSPFFNLTQFLKEASRHICEICDKVLDTSEMGFDLAVTDTLVSLGPEFKFLPLWAGGDDDGSGGVYDPNIPSASGGPSGPGPSFHTGFSNASAPSSEFGFSELRSVNTSVEVDDGFSSHVDRRRMIADDEFHSETFSEDSELYGRKGKGVDRSGYVLSHTPSEASSATMDGDYVSVGAARSVASSETADDETMSYGGFSDSETVSAAETTDINVDEDDNNSMNGEADGPQIEEDETWDEGDVESFDFGDSDEEMVMV